MSRAYCDQDHPGSDREAADWCRRYHRPRLPRIPERLLEANVPCPGGAEAHEAHLDMNDECPWCGATR